MELTTHNKKEYPPMHTAEHLLNQTMHRLFGCPRSKNTHIERKKSKCDYLLAAAPTAEQLQAVEEAVNQQIQLGLPVTEQYLPLSQIPTEVDLSKLPIHTGDTIRLIRIGEYDLCACIGNHVQNTAQIGAFKISSSSYQDGLLRLRFKLENSSW